MSKFTYCSGVLEPIGIITSGTIDFDNTPYRSFTNDFNPVRRSLVEDYQGCGAIVYPNRQYRCDYCGRYCA
jgi:hypothetical protein